MLLAGALLRAKEYDRAQRALDDARGVAASTSQHAYASELHRLQGELLTLTNNRDGAERSYREALATANSQGALWLELRAARAFAHFLAAAERVDEARSILQPTLERITEGRATLDYVYADGLLRTLE